MSSATKILLGIFSLIVVVLGIEGYLFFQSSTKPPIKKGAPASSPTPKASSVIDVTGKPILAGNLDFTELGKAQAEEWVKTTGAVTVVAYSGPLPTFPLISSSLPSSIATLSALQVQRPTSVKVLAGYLKTQTEGAIGISQLTGKLTVSFIPHSRLWIKKGNKIQVAATTIDNMLAAIPPSLQGTSIGDLVLALDITDKNGILQSDALVVFK